ncbi:AP-4 complex subunit beta-1-like [Diadema antillarum]|uniref:AP-4 complex subunit beta-1-like n=1 Tax=Diadema antillarum TaxID=105358 RepID=UPI003A84A079
MALLSEGFGDDDIRELRVSLADAAANSDPTQLRAALAQIVSQMTQGNTLSGLFPELVKICATSDLPSKKLVYMYMACCACEQPSLTLLVINCLLKDCQDSNPMVRGMALKTLCSLRLPLLLEYIEPPLLAGLKDKSAYVRRIAVLGCLKANKLNPAFIKDRNIIEQLCELVADRDNTVMLNVLCVLHSLEGALHVSQNMAHQLLNRLHTLSEWGMIKALHFLLSYKPEKEEEIFDIMNVVDGCVRHPSSGVSIGAIHLMLRLTAGLPQVHQDVLRRLKGVLLSHLTSTQPAVVYAALCHLEGLLARVSLGLSKHFKKFFCKYNEPLYLRCKRIDLLVELTTENNVVDIVGELSVNCLDVSTRFGQHAVGALGNISHRSPAYVAPCMDALLNLLQLRIDHVSSAVLVEMQDLLSFEGKYQDYVDQVLDSIPACWTQLEDAESRCAMIWLIGHHGQRLSDAPYLLESAIDNIMEETSTEVKGRLLTAVTKLFFTRPAECQDCLATILQHCAETEKDVILREKALQYYKMLNTDVKKARAVICSSQSLRPPPERRHHGEGLQDIQLFNTFGMLLGSTTAEDNELPDESSLKSKYDAPSHQSATPHDRQATMEGTLVDLDTEEVGGHKGPFGGHMQELLGVDLRGGEGAHNAGVNESVIGPVENVLQKDSDGKDVVPPVNPGTASAEKENSVKAELTLLDEGKTPNGKSGTESITSGSASASQTDKGDSDVAPPTLLPPFASSSTSAPVSVAPDNGQSLMEEVAAPGMAGLQGVSIDPLPKQTKEAVLDEDFSLSAQAFEEKWMSWTTSETFEASLGKERKPSVLLQAFNSLGFHTMASTPEEADPWRAFLYAKALSGGLILLEVTTHQSSGKTSVCIKPEDGWGPALSNQAVALCRKAFSSAPAADPSKI